jgi:hypothetical protein
MERKNIINIFYNLALLRLRESRASEHRLLFVLIPLRLLFYVQLI